VFSSGLSEAHPDPFARLTHDSAMGNLLFRGRTIEIPGTTSTERKLSPMVRCGVSPHEMEAEAARYKKIEWLVGGDPFYLKF